MSVTAAEFELEMNGLADHLMDGAGEFLREQIPLIVSDVQQNFDTAETAGGQAWKPHAPATVRRHGPHPLLILSGTLKGAALGTNGYHVERTIESPNEAALQYGISGLPYAGVHQDGSEVLPEREHLYSGMGAQQFHLRPQEARIPQREYLAINEGTVDTIVERAADFFQSKFEEK